MTLTTLAGVPVLLALVAVDLADPSIRQWFDAHALTTDALVSIVVLLIAVLNVDRVLRRRQLRDRSRVVAAHAAILGRHAQRATNEVKELLAEPREDTEAASDELRTYMAMLMIAAPVLMDGAQARRFLEDAQELGGLLSRAVARRSDLSSLAPRLDATVQAMHEDAGPLLAALDHAERGSVDAHGDDESAEPGSA